MLSRLPNLFCECYPAIYLFVNTVILKINAQLKKCEWAKFIVFELKCYLINANGVIECELKTATKIITNKIQSNLISNVLTGTLYTNVLTNEHLK